MIYCVPSETNQGIDAPVSDHFGRCAFFTIYNDETGETASVENRNTHDGHGECRPLDSISGYGVNAVLAGGMGRGAVTRLNADGIDVYRAEGSQLLRLTVRHLIEAHRTGGLELFTPENACGGHAHHHA